MPSYLIERTNKKTGKSKTELVNAESVYLALLKQGKKYGEGYTYRLVGHLTVSSLYDHNKINKDQDTISIALHDQAYQRYRLINRQPGK